MNDPIFRLRVQHNRKIHGLICGNVGVWEYKKVLNSQDREKRLKYEAREKAILDHNQMILEAKERGEERISKLFALLVQDDRFEDLYSTPQRFAVETIVAWSIYCTAYCK